MSLARLLVQRAALLGLILVLGAAGLIYPFPFHGLIWSELFNLAHAPAFAMLLLLLAGLQDPAAVGLARYGRSVRTLRPTDMLVSVVLLAGLGVAAELAQRYTGRNASWGDVRANIAGLGVGILVIVALRSSRVRRRFAAGGAVVLLTAVSLTPVLRITEGLRQRYQLPLVSSFEYAAEISVWEPLNSEFRRTTGWSAHGHRSLKVLLQPAEFSGVSLIWPPSDWGKYRQFCMELSNPGEHELHVTLKLQDQDHAASDYHPADRFHLSVIVPAGGHRSVEIDLEDAVRLPSGRTMDLSRIARLEVFTTDLPSPAVLLLDHLRLSN